MSDEIRKLVQSYHDYAQTHLPSDSSNFLATEIAYFLRSRLSEVEKENSILKEEIHFRDNTEEEADEELMNRIKLAEGEQAWGCGHTNHGSCAQCLGHVTNERNALRSLLFQSKELLGHFGWTSSESVEVLRKAEKLISEIDAAQGKEV